jgi:hypothetical protein
MSGFTLDELVPTLSNYPIAKGDTPGHPFRGNQWKSIGDAISKIHDEAHALAGRAKGMTNRVYAELKRPIEEVQKNHDDIADKHIAIANKLFDIGHYLGKKLGLDHPVVKALAKAEKLHSEAISKHYDASDSDGGQREPKEAALASAAAARATEEALRTHAYLTDPKSGEILAN